MNQITVQDRSGLPEHVRDGVLRKPNRWLVLTKNGRKVAELPVEDLDKLNSVQLESFFIAQELEGRDWKIEHR